MTFINHVFIISTQRNSRYITIQVQQHLKQERKEERGGQGQREGRREGVKEQRQGWGGKGNAKL